MAIWKRNATALLSHICILILPIFWIWEVQILLYTNIKCWKRFLVHPKSLLTTAWKSTTVNETKKLGEKTVKRSFEINACWSQKNFKSVQFEGKMLWPVFPFHCASMYVSRTCACNYWSLFTTFFSWVFCYISVNHHMTQSSSISSVKRKLYWQAQLCLRWRA